MWCAVFPKFATGPAAAEAEGYTCSPSGREQQEAESAGVQFMVRRNGTRSCRPNVLQATSKPHSDLQHRTLQSLADRCLPTQLEDLHPRPFIARLKQSERRQCRYGPRHTCQDAVAAMQKALQIANGSAPD